MLLYKVKDTEIIQKLVVPEELSGLLNLALAGLHRVKTQNNFTTSKTSVDIMHFWVKESDSFLGFCLDFLKQDPENFVTKEAVRKRYQKYCKEERLMPEGDKRMKYMLSKLFGAVEDRKTIGEEGQTMVWDGVSFMDEKKDWNNLRGE